MDPPKGKRLIVDFAVILIPVLLVLTAAALIWLHNLVAVVMLLGFYSLLMAGLWVILDAVDVAFTEAAVGAGITTVLMLAAVGLTGQGERPGQGNVLVALVVVAVTGGALFYALSDLPPFGAADAPAHTHVASRYLGQSMTEAGIPNVVTAVLASYRGYDTLGEVTVIFAAGISVLALFSRRHGDRKN